MQTQINFDDLLKLKPIELLKYCIQEPYQGSGAGGQKRNRVYSGIRLKLKEYPIDACNCEHRETKRNTESALLELRKKIAYYAISAKIDFGEIPQLPTAKISQENPQYPFFIYQLLSLLWTHQGLSAQIAPLMNWTHSALLRQIGRDAKLAQEFHKIRDHFQLARLKLGG